MAKNFKWLDWLTINLEFALVLCDPEAFLQSVVGVLVQGDVQEVLSDDIENLDEPKINGFDDCVVRIRGLHVSNQSVLRDKCVKDRLNISVAL